MACTSQRLTPIELLDGNSGLGIKVPSICPRRVALPFLVTVLCLGFCMLIGFVMHIPMDIHLHVRARRSPSHAQAQRELAMELDALDARARQLHADLLEMDAQGPRIPPERPLPPLADAVRKVRAQFLDIRAAAEEQMLVELQTVLSEAVDDLEGRLTQLTAQFSSDVISQLKASLAAAAPPGRPAGGLRPDERTPPPALPERFRVECDAFYWQSRRLLMSHAAECLRALRERLPPFALVCAANTLRSGADYDAEIRALFQKAVATMDAQVAALQARFLASLEGEVAALSHQLTLVADAAPPLTHQPALGYPAKPQLLAAAHAAPQIESAVHQATVSWAGAIAAAKAAASQTLGRELLLVSGPDPHLQLMHDLTSQLHQTLETVRAVHAQVR